MDRSVELYTVDGVRLSGRYWPADGSRLAYVVGHGFTVSSRHPAVTAVCQRLAGRGAAVVALDFRGHGRSAGSSSIGAVEDLDVAAGVAFLRAAGHEVVTTAGWSMGGSLVLRHAALHHGPTGVDAVVSVSSPGLWFERGTRMMRRVNFAAETRLGRRLVGWGWRTRIDRGWAETPLAPVELVHHIAPTPLLLVHGDTDPYFPLRHVQALAAAAPGATVWEEAGMGHAESGTRPELVDRIDAWVRRVTGTGGPLPARHPG